MNTLPPRRATFGRCHACKVIWRWPSHKYARVRDAHCPRCGTKLARTAEALVKRIPVVDGTPTFRRSMLG